MSAVKTVVLVGSPNVGKSVVFHRLTGAYATVSNYPGTTVELMSARVMISGQLFEIIDTPGLYSLLTITEEESVTRRLILSGGAGILVHVIDAKNLARMLPLTLQLMETGIPTILDLNMLDEAVRAGLKIDLRFLERRLGIPVAGTISITGAGIEDLKGRLCQVARKAV